MEAVGRRPSIDTKQPEITLYVLAGKTEHTYCLDLSGDSLHKRGYRRFMTDAPIKENLAAAILQKPSFRNVTRKSYLTQCVVQAHLLLKR